MEDFIISSLKRIVGISLGGPRGDPDYCNIMAAAHAYAILEKLNVPNVQEEIQEFSNDNGEEYIERARRGVSY